MRKQLPDSWNRWDAIEIAEELIRKEKSYHKVRVTSIEIVNYFGKDEVFCHYEFTHTTSRNKLPSPSQITLPLDVFVKKLRERRINDILNNDGVC